MNYPEKIGKKRNLCSGTFALEYLVTSLIRVALATFLMIPTVALAQSAPKAAVLPFEMRIELQMDGMSLYGLPPKPKKAEQERLEMARQKLIDMVVSRGAYEVVDLSKYKSEMKRAAPFEYCDGCEVEFGKKAGADVTILGVVQKASEMMINVAVFVRDTNSGKLTKSMAVSVLQNDDAGWSRAVRHLVNNRLAPEVESK
ncbi:MAG: DUF3280 domain-containing protein [Alphaproteobacteria bacterium]|nr:DUF3280 domain-containing protein [Alphaproteobacteria bacterium]